MSYTIGFLLENDRWSADKCFIDVTHFLAQELTKKEIKSKNSMSIKERK